MHKSFWNIFAGKALSLSLFFTLFLALPLSAQEETEIEEIVVIGVRSSIEKSIDEKRNADGIKDVITAEDIGQLPDENIAEALQRVTGIQMARTAEGEGSTIQIRGISDNNVEINGQTFVGGVGDRSVNFRDIPSELFSGIEVLKTPSADRIEGSLGGTVNFKTRRPLEISKDSTGSVTLKGKYADITKEEHDNFFVRVPDINIFLSRNFRDIGIGDIGFLVNFSRKLILSKSDAFGGGDYSTAPGAWARLNFGTPGQGGVPGGFPFNFGTWTVDKTIATTDLNGDGTANQHDIYYAPANLIAHARYGETVNRSWNISTQWQPNYALTLFLDFTTTNTIEDRWGSQFSVSLQRNNTRPLLLGTQAGLTSFDILPNGQHYLSEALIAGGTLRFGGAPSLQHVVRDTDKITIGGDWQVNERLLLKLEASTSRGKTHNSQTQFTMSHDWQRHNPNTAGKSTGGDNRDIIYYDWTVTDLPNFQLFAPPFVNGHSGAGGFTATSFDTLRMVNPVGLDEPSLHYRQLNRIDSDTDNTANSAQIDGTYKLERGLEFFTKLLSGIRFGERDFTRRSWRNVNQHEGNSTPKPAGGPTNAITAYGTPNGGPYTVLDVQHLYVNPAVYTNADGTIKTGMEDAYALSKKLSEECFGRAYVNFNGVTGTFPREWARTTCSIDYYTDLFNMHPIRAIDPLTGAGIYEETTARYEVSEATRNFYLRADFDKDIFSDMRFFGNMGIRYAYTEVESTGYRKIGSKFELVTSTGRTEDFLPSLNANLWITNTLVLRLGIYRALTRPSVQALSLGLNIVEDTTEGEEGLDMDGNPIDDDGDDYYGSGRSGNPELEPITADSFDLSLEWYYRKNSLASAALFYKDIDSSISSRSQPLDIFDDGRLYLVNSPYNAPGTQIQGFELALQHTMESEGFWGNVGFGFNYTFTDEDTNLLDQEGDAIPRTRLSPHSYNLTAFYDDGKFSIRLAYNWRDDFVRRNAVQLGFNRPERLPEFEKARGQLDLSMNYNFNPSLRLNFSAVNINKSQTVRYLKYEALQNYFAQSGARYTISLTQRF